jgi:hypothetical protein
MQTKLFKVLVTATTIATMCAVAPAAMAQKAKSKPTDAYAQALPSAQQPAPRLTIRPSAVQAPRPDSGIICTNTGCGKIYTFGVAF